MIKSRILQFLVVSLGLVFPVLAQNGNSYYLSSSQGSDSNDGNISSPWATLEKISSVTLAPGDAVFFRKGDRFDGHFVVNGSGSADSPIIISSYGEGEKPIITGEVGEAGGGDYQEAILVENNEYITFDGLEIQNERLVNRAGVDEQDAFGIYVLNSGNETMRGFKFQNMTFRNVYAPKPLLDPDSFNGLIVAGLSFLSNINQSGNVKHIRDVVVENCYFTDIQRLGVHMRHTGASGGVGNDSLNRNMNFLFRNNEFFQTGGTCILPTRTYNVLIEDNTFNQPGSNADPRMPNRGSAVWNWRSINTVIQRNQCIGIRGYLDSHGIHVDHENVDTFIQYNYMEDCEGGFVEILGGNLNAVYRFNISVNDGWRNNPNWVNSNHTIWLNEKSPGNEDHPSEYSYIYNNTIFMDSAYSTVIDIDGKHTHIYNNIFYAAQGQIGVKRMVIENNGTALFMKNNLFYGDIGSSFINSGSDEVMANPMLVEEGSSNPEGYDLTEQSPAVNAGINNAGPPMSFAGKGIFENLTTYPEVDYFGNPVDFHRKMVNIGASNIKFGDNPDLILGLEKLQEEGIKLAWRDDTIHIDFEAAGVARIQVFNLSGKIIADLQRSNPHIEIQGINAKAIIIRIQKKGSLFVTKLMK